MDKIISTLTVMFEDPFWIGIYERNINEKYEVSKITFGAEPKDYQVYEYILDNYKNLRFSPSINCKSKLIKPISPKKLQKKIKKQLNQGIGTKAQQALSLQKEEGKIKRKTISREEKLREKEIKFNLKQQKIKEKHKGH